MNRTTTSHPQQWTRGWFWPALCLVAATRLILFVPPAESQSRSALSEADVKAGFIFNFPKFIEWPRSSLVAAKQFSVCLVDSDLDKVLNPLLREESVFGKPMRVEKKTAGQPLEDCHILFIGGGNRRRNETLLRSLATKPVLTIGENEDFLRNGGIIRLTKVANRIRFDINAASARRAGLEISSRLLRLAETVEGQGRR